MTLWPRSLFGRSAALIVLLILLGQVVGLLLMRELIMKPRMAQMADGLARDISGMRAGLAALPPASRSTFVDAFNQRALADTQALPATGMLGALLTPMERNFVRQVSLRVAAEGGGVVWRREAGGSLALRLDLDGTDYWIVLPSVLPAREFSGAWAAATAASILLALLGGLFAQRRINQPLTRMVGVAETLARGGVPERLPEEGPAEIAQLSRSINQMVLDLQDTERERALMLAGVSHDLRTPLAKLRLAVEIQRPRSEPQLTASMTRSIEEMDAIVGQFLDFARSDDSEVPAPVDLDALGRDVAQASLDHGRALALALGGVPRVALRPLALRRALDNLVENAWKHGKPPVTLRTGSNADAVWVEVTDRGEGIAVADIDALKQPFRRAASDRGGPPGAGLGLAIVERVARVHGGQFDLLPVAGGGLCARLTFPRDVR